VAPLGEGYVAGLYPEMTTGQVRQHTPDGVFPYEESRKPRRISMDSNRDAQGNRPACGSGTTDAGDHGAHPTRTCAEGTRSEKL